MTLRRHLIDRTPFDPAGQLLGALLDTSGGQIALLNPGQTPEPGDEVWFTSQRAFLEAATRMGEWRTSVNVILRRPADVSETKAVLLEFAVVQSVAAGLPADVDVKFFALSTPAAEFAMDQGISECDPLGMPNSTDRTLDLAEILPATTRFQLMHRDDPVPLGFADVNWARLAKRFRIIARFDNAPDIVDLADLAGRLPQEAGKIRVAYLFITPNGIGLGHLTRQLAVAQALIETAPPGAKPEITFWCFSRAAIIVRKAGHKVILRHTAEHLKADGKAWLRWETETLAHYLRYSRPMAIIADGSRIEPFIVQAMNQPGCHHARLIWIRRGMWRADADDRGMADVRYCDHVLIPGDLSAQADPGATARDNPNSPGLSRETITPPVLLLTGKQQLDRRSARRELGLGRGKICLVSLGGDSFARTSIVHDKLVFAAQKAGVQLVWAHSPLAAQPGFVGPGDLRLALYPVNPYLAAFDGIISAAGYNSFHELMLLCDAPVLFVPTTNERLDDQAARARHAALQGWCTMLDHESADDEDMAFLRFFESLRSSAKSKRPRLARDGADEMAQIISGLVDETGETR